ncbi:mandelate racemase [Kitasatospora sp. YST-16]|uniref:enolase C-terminal domain-like protein n=1 Tax=Kitasatospora sp. YST-16 TaxID=2998080 RepID=UPI0022840B88|nr:enolase C-terminal domain-like protein [Kitasatospora sp. YST-16]WAL75102.1 mandelate racemase [Kitasatospora sp. YST-16]WNW41160.1 enolase C-terminal domain-like protein [Streptomyces sp. Li-HN-5-13]
MTDLLIDKVETLLTSGGTETGDDTVFVAVHGGGQTGWYGPVGLAVAQAVEAIGPAVAGASLLDHHALRPRLRASAPAVSDWAVGAIDCAAWDLHGRLVGWPVADLLAPGRKARAVPAYASWLRTDLSGPANRSALTQVLDEGWAFTKWGLRRRPGPSIAAEARDLVEALERAASVIDAPFAVDAVGTWSPQLAAAVVPLLGQPHLAWLEDPLPDHYLRTYSQLAAAGVPIALGERIRPDEDLSALLGVARPTALTIDVVGCGGLTRAAEITAASHGVGVPVYPHGRSMVPGIHLATAFPDAVRAVEYRHQWEPRRQLLYAEPWIPENGRFPAPEAPGLGTQPRSTR